MQIHPMIIRQTQGTAKKCQGQYPTNKLGEIKAGGDAGPTRIGDRRICWGGWDKHPMECTISGMCIIRKTLMTLAFGLFLVCASFGFFPPIVLPRWLAPAVHHVKVVRRTGKSQNKLRHVRNPHLPMRNSQLSLDQYQTTLQSSGNTIDCQRYPQISFSQCCASG
tara:strand:+ start:160 stop:654 length:495 start_codon:yes stop_codon:yes gene_type:complete